MNYVQRIIDAIVVELPDVSQELAELYALLVLSKGTETTLEDVHDAWSIWCNKLRPEHSSLIPFEQLSERIQEMDRHYTEGLHKVTTKLKESK